MAAHLGGTCPVCLSPQGSLDPYAKPLWTGVTCLVVVETELVAPALFWAIAWATPGRQLRIGPRLCPQEVHVSW